VCRTFISAIARLSLRVDVGCLRSFERQFVNIIVVVVVSVEAKLSFVEPGRRWAHSPSSSGAPGVSYQGTMKTSVRMLRT